MTCFAKLKKVVCMLSITWGFVQKYLPVTEYFKLPNTIAISILSELLSLFKCGDTTIIFGLYVRSL
jgi:hypothetical protein